MSADDPFAPLEHRPIVGAIVGVIASALVLGAVGWGVAGWLGVPRHPLGYVLGALAVFGAIEVRVQRARARRLHALGGLLRALGRALDTPRAGWIRGLPWVGGATAAGHACTAHVAWAGADRHRIVLTVDIGAEPELWICAAELDDAPRREIARLRRKHRLLDVDGLPAGLSGLAPAPAAVAERWVERPAAAAEIEALVRHAAPRAVTLDLRADAIAWDAPFDAVEGVDAALAVLDRLAALAAQWGRGEDAAEVPPAAGDHLIR